MPVDFNSAVNEPLLDVYGEAVTYKPLESQPTAPEFQLTVIFEAQHEILLEEVADSETKAAGHSTTAPVLTARLADFAEYPMQGDHVTIRGTEYRVWDPQPDGQGMIDLLLRKVI